MVAIAVALALGTAKGTLHRGQHLQQLNSCISDVMTRSILGLQGCSLSHDGSEIGLFFDLTSYHHTTSCACMLP